MMESEISFSFQPIGYYHASQKYRFEVPRQGVLSPAQGIIQLLPHRNYDQAARDLSGFDRIWLIYVFHLNTHWRPYVRPPRRNCKKKVSVFATRAPHRPNMIGLSCVKLEEVKGLVIRVSESDLLDGTPILDIKPYLPYCDSFPSAATGWLEDQDLVSWKVDFSPLAQEQIREIQEFCNLDLENFARLQLEYEPTNPQTKRIRLIDSTRHLYFLGCRTWRIYYEVLSDKYSVYVLQIGSGYSHQDLMDEKTDPYQDKAFHLRFIKKYPVPGDWLQKGKIPSTLLECLDQSREDELGGRNV